MEEIAAYLEKSKESLASATDDLAQKRYNSCASRAYYACYQAAVALLTSCGIAPRSSKDIWRHEAVQAQIALLIRRKKALSSKHRETLSEVMSTRLVADYEPTHISRKKSNRVLKKTQEFVSLVEKEIRHDRENHPNP